MWGAAGAVSDLHQDFLDAEADHQFAGPLRQLASALRKLSWKLKGEWAWYMLPRGAMVAMRVDPRTFKKQLRIARRSVARSSLNRWAVEIETFLKELDCADWVQLETHVDAAARGGEDEPVRAKVWVLYEEPAPLGSPPKPTCAECGKECEPSPTFKRHICNQCAVKLGNQEVADRAKEPA